MFLGRIIETGPTEAVFERPNHPYTAALMSAAPKLEVAQRGNRIVLKGEVPSPAALGPGRYCDSMSVAAYSIVAVAIILASCMQASIGFGMGMLAAPIVAIVDPGLIPGTLIMLATLLTIFVVIREHQAIDLAGTGWALAGRVPGTIAGALLLAALPERALALTLAGVVLAGVALTSTGWMPAPHRRNLVLAGATSGVLGTATAIGGPPMALVWQNTTGARLRGTMSGFFLVGSLMSIAVLTITGAVDGRTVSSFVVLTPAVAIGYALSRLVNHLLDRQRQRWVAITISALGAIVLIVRQLVGF